MKSTRWAVVSLDQGGPDISDFLGELNVCFHVDAQRMADLPSALAGAQGVIFITGPQALVQTVECVAVTQRQYPGTTLIAAVYDLDSVQLAALVSAGVYDFISIPGTPGEWAIRLQRACAVVQRDAPQIQNQETPAPIRGFVYKSALCAQVAARLPALAACDANVLVLGETGTGKEVCAQAIHYLSSRAARPWVAVNCAAIPADLVENELFGHVRGAYTTAHEARSGLVLDAEGGTLFLDDVDCLPLAAQAKLLRFLQEREYRPVGSSAVLHANVRIIAASNCNLNALSQQGGFRQDLYFRLNVLNVHLPALRDRREDIAVLAVHFARQFASEFSRDIRDVSPAALARLTGYDWPGNVRELRHVLERAVLLTRGPLILSSDIEIDSEPAWSVAAGPDDNESFRLAKMRVVESFERSYLERLLAASRGNVTQAAMAAKKNRRAFFQLMRKYQIASDRFRPGAP